VVKFDFYHAKLRKQPFLQNFKIQGASPMVPLPTPMTSVVPKRFVSGGVLPDALLSF